MLSSLLRLLFPSFRVPASGSRISACVFSVAAVFPALSFQHLCPRLFRACTLRLFSVSDFIVSEVLPLFPAPRPPVPSFLFSSLCPGLRLRSFRVSALRFPLSCRCAPAAFVCRAPRAGSADLARAGADFLLASRYLCALRFRLRIIFHIFACYYAQCAMTATKTNINNINFFDSNAK